MDDNFKHVFEGQLSTSDHVAINVVQNRDLSPTTHFIKNVLADGTNRDAYKADRKILEIKKCGATMGKTQ